MANDPHREAIQARETAIALEALMREEAVVNYYAARGKKVLSTTDQETRTVLHMGVREPAADVLVELGPQQLIIAEVKGTNLDRALVQLASTAQKAALRYPNISCKIYARSQAPPGDAIDLRGGGYGFRAVRIFHRGFPGEWVLYEYEASGKSRLVEIGSGPVCIAFGPHV